MPYILMVFVIGLPIFFAELFVGQYGGLGPIKAYTRLAPFFHGTQCEHIKLHKHSIFITRGRRYNKYTLRKLD